MSFPTYDPGMEWHYAENERQKMRPLLKAITILTVKALVILGGSGEEVREKLTPEAMVARISLYETTHVHKELRRLAGELSNLFSVMQG